MQNRRWVVKVNRQAIICFFLLLLLTLLVGANTNNPDLHNYIYNYSRRTTVVEGSFAFSFVNNLFYRNGITFQVFRLCLYAIGYIILGIAAKRLVGDKPILYIFYAIAFMMIDGTQTYNFMGMCLLLLGVSFLIVENTARHTAGARSACRCPPVRYAESACPVCRKKTVCDGKRTS